MAERRMFSRTVTGSARFLKLSSEARLLYYDLGMEADDDGFAEAFVLLRMTGAREEALSELAEKGFVEILNDDLVVHINDWQRNNLVRKDRYRRSIYLDLFPQYDTEKAPDAQEEEAVHQAVNPLSPGRLTQDRKGKDRLEVRVGEDRLNQDNIYQDTAVQLSTGEVRTRVREAEKCTKNERNVHLCGETCGDPVGTCGKVPFSCGEDVDKLKPIRRTENGRFADWNSYACRGSP